MRMKKILKEPLLHFLLLALLMYGITSFVNNKTDPSNKIVINNAIVGRLVTKYMVQTGTPPNKAQLEALINAEIKEEIEYREAMRMGLDKDDEIIRRRLSQKLKFLKSDLATVEEPSEDELKKFYVEHPKMFRDSSKVNFTHIYLNGDKATFEQINKRAAVIFNELEANKLSRAPELGDRFPLQYDYTEINRLEANQLFGNSQLSDTLLNVLPHQWIGPVKSGYGWHLVYVQEHKEGGLSAFDNVKNKVR